jgi:hypothetical protein
MEDGSVTDIADTVRGWANEIATRRIGAVLMNNPDERGEPHLWAHVQEGVLVEAGQALGDDDLIQVARASARELLAPIVRGGFDRPSVTPYDVASVVYSLDRLGRADGAEWSDLAATARSWFDHVDRAGRPVYDREKGRVADGVDDGRVSENSGAEANAVAAGSLFDDAVRSAKISGKLLPKASNG